MSSRVASSSTRRRASSPSPVVIARSSLVTRSRSMHASRHADSTLVKRARSSSARRRAVSVAISRLRSATRCASSARTWSPRALACASCSSRRRREYSSSRLSWSNSVPRMRSSSSTTRACSSWTRSISVGELGAGLVRRREPRLRGALLLRRAEALELTAQARTRCVRPSVRADASSSSSWRSSCDEAARFLGGPQVAACERFHLGQALARPAASGDRRGVDGDRLDA